MIKSYFSGLPYERDHPGFMTSILTYTTPMTNTPISSPDWRAWQIGPQSDMHPCYGMIEIG